MIKKNIGGGRRAGGVSSKKILRARRLRRRKLRRLSDRLGARKKFFLRFLEMESRRRGFAAMGSDYGTREIFDCERVFF